MPFYLGGLDSLLSVLTRRKVAHSGRSPHGEGQRLLELALIPKSVGPRQEAEVFPQEYHATERSPQPVSGDDRNLHVLPVDSKQVTEQISAGTILAEKAPCLQAARDRMPSLLTLPANGHFGSCPPQSTAGSPGRNHEGRSRAGRSCRTWGILWARRKQASS